MPRYKKIKKCIICNKELIKRSRGANYCLKDYRQIVKNNESNKYFVRKMLGLSYK